MLKVKNGNKARNMIILFGLTVLFTAMLRTHLVFAVEGADQIASIVQMMVDIIGMIFSAVGVILAVYSVGQLIMAFKNEDPDSKTRSSTLVIVSIVLIAFPAIVKGLNLVEMITN